ncbi:uncharacterized protein LOC127120515 [Lathyrus oleraceus]|uniref:uncharacterized protein LOC127120515 n=1 Tax=Pisum sativum TaxID=3888 RepID=UPI0021D37FF4|nr:uncharacterized protein LOC127120515 [Pisum sativum]
MTDPTTTTVITNDDGTKSSISKPPRPKRRICFSFTTYANNLIQRLKSSNVIIEKGLSDTEFSFLESKLNITFPPDLRAILQQGLPVSLGFPNWRSSSHQQLQILLNLPVSSILRCVSDNRFWHPSWGPLPEDPLSSAERILNGAPRLIPVYRHCYIVSSPNAAGNPVFYVDHGGDVRLASFDVVGFFRDAGFLNRIEEVEDPVWAATKARSIQVWSEVADGRGERKWKWWWDDRRDELSGCMDWVLRRLREGGWKEEEIHEMMNEDEEEKEKRAPHMSVLGLKLLGAGWSREDVVYSLGVDLKEAANASIIDVGVNMNHQ